LAGGAFLSLLFLIFADSDNKVATSHHSELLLMVDGTMKQARSLDGPARDNEGNF
jgi:hypothetical protein